MARSSLRTARKVRTDGRRLFRRKLRKADGSVGGSIHGRCSARLARASRTSSERSVAAGGLRISRWPADRPPGGSPARRPTPVLGGPVRARAPVRLRRAMRPTLGPSLLVTVLSLAGHVRPQFSPDPELLDAAPRLVWARSGSMAGPACRCGRGVMPGASMRRQVQTAGKGARCTCGGESRCRPETTAVARRSPVVVPLPSPAAVVRPAAAWRAASAPRVAPADRRGRRSTGAGDARGGLPRLTRGGRIRCCRARRRSSPRTRARRSRRTSAPPASAASRGRGRGGPRRCSG